MAKSKNKGSSDTLKQKKTKELDMRPHEVRKRQPAMNGGTGTGSSAQSAAARG